MPLVLLLLCGLFGLRLVLLVPSFSAELKYYKNAENAPLSKSTRENATSDEAASPLGPLLPVADGNSTRSSHPSTNTASPQHHPNFHVQFPLCLVHIGKTAGSSISCGLGLMYANCEGMPRERLPNNSVQFFHMRRNTCSDARTDVVTLRNPVTRLRSWFDFEKDILPTRRNAAEQDMIRRQRGLLFKVCYASFADFIATGLQPLPNSTVAAADPVDMTCPERAWAAALGVRAFSYHEWFNYEYYWTALLQKRQKDGANGGNQSLFVLRTEHLLEDWGTVSTEPLFRAVNKATSRNASSAATEVETQWPSNALANLCRALCPEIQVYKQILAAASNLDAIQKNESLQEVVEWCPAETLQLRDDCPGIPSFPVMQVPRRHYRSEIKQRLFAAL